jgi:hypothetical protein
MKILSFIGMILSYMLIIVLLLLYLPSREYFVRKDTVLLVIELGIAVAFFVVSFIIATTFKWGNKNSFIPQF